MRDLSSLEGYQDKTVVHGSRLTKQSSDIFALSVWCFLRTLYHGEARSNKESEKNRQRTFPDTDVVEYDVNVGRLIFYGCKECL
uniref:Uncharacterized protein n=1 Tax=Timema tahoe TaxID=61484 RepID=A0A7R9IBP0_9NEOP|nr:unnamed protein product [Timema tahoe]